MKTVRKDYLKGIRLTFDKKEIRKNVYYITYKEARRSKFCIYDTLLKELYEENCLVTAKYFESLVELEDKLLKEGTIRDRVSNEPKLLFGLYDKCKAAEKVLFHDTSESKRICCRLLLQCLYWCDNFLDNYDWIVHEMHSIIPKMSTKLHEHSQGHIADETHCLILYKSAELLAKSNAPLSIKLLRKAFDIAQGTTWAIKVGDLADGAMLVSMTKGIAKTLAVTLLKDAYDIVQRDATAAIRNAEDALYAIAKGNFGHTNDIFLLAYLDLAYFFLEDSRYEEAINSLEQVKQRLDACTTEADNYMQMLCKYYHFAGICYDRIDKKDLALRNHLDCIEIARKAKLEDYEARSLLQLAKIYTTLGYVQSRMAEQCLKQAKIIFTKQNDRLSLKMCKFVQAKTKSLFIYPMVYDLIRYYKNSPCNRYRLLQWKNRCFPFWINKHTEHDREKSNPIQCVITRSTEYATKRIKTNNFRRTLP